MSTQRLDSCPWSSQARTLSFLFKKCHGSAYDRLAFSLSPPHARFVAFLTMIRSKTMKALSSTYNAPVFQQSSRALIEVAVQQQLHIEDSHNILELPTHVGQFMLIEYLHSKCLLNFSKATSKETCRWSCFRRGEAWKQKDTCRH